MKTMIGWMAAVLLVAGCNSVPPPPVLPETGASKAGKNEPERVLVDISAADKRAAKAKLFTAVDRAGLRFGPLFGTAANAQGEDLAVCGFASRGHGDGNLYFAYYNGELLLRDETAPHGASIENQFLALICSHD
ncbi:hypothetical protein [Phytopseudomonas dryadis]|nr:hypothetical protein [Pseudomonas dryadis]